MNSKDPISIVKNDDYNNPTVTIVVKDRSVTLTTKRARQFGLNIIAVVDELERKSNRIPQPINRLEMEPTSCRLKFWANPAFMVW